MVSFRFHIVSLVAVFLSLALGIAMGVTVIDKATVDLLQERLNGVRNEVNAANQRSDTLQRQLGRSDDYDERVESYLINKKLEGDSVTLIGIRGIDQGSINELKHTLTASGALVQGTLWFTDKMRFDDARAASSLAIELGASSSDPTILRQALLARVNAVLAGGTDQKTLSPLVDSGFLDWDGEKGIGNMNQVPFGDSRLIVVSGFNPAVPNDQVALPLVKLLAAQPHKRLVAVEAGRDGDAHNAAQRAVFTGPLRSDSSLNGKLSTVDNIEVSSGRVATVLALANIAKGDTGNYGYAGSTDGPIPKTTSS